jgi:hypothetical protein
VRCRIAFVAAVVALGAWCGWVSGFHRTSGAAEITWVLSTAAVAAVDLALWWRRNRVPAMGSRVEPWPRPGQGGAGRALVGVAPWLALIVITLAWDVLGIDTGPHRYHLTISALAQAYRPLDAALLLAWMLGGVGYEVARLRAPDLRAPGGPAVAHVGEDGGEGDCDSGAEGGAETGGGSRSALGAGVAGLASHPGAATPALLLPSSPPVGVAFWIAVPAAAVVLDLAARRTDGRMARAEEFVRFVSTAPWVNVVLVAAWLVAGYHLFAR